MTLDLEDVKEKLAEAKIAKRKHKASNQCTAKDGGACSACHYWSGVISVLGDLLGEPGQID